MAKLTLTDVGAGVGLATTINNNNALVEAAVENTLSRDGTTPNAMLANLDLGGFRVVNLGAPVNPTDAVRLQDVIDMILAAQA